MSTEPRTLRRRTRPADTGDDDDEETTAPKASKPGKKNKKAKAEGNGQAEDKKAIYDALHGGWTEGQKVMDSTASFAQAFKPDKDPQVIRFLQDAPYVNYRRHWVDRMDGQGKTQTRAYLCLESVGKQCPLCDIGDKPQAVSAFNVALIGDDGQVLLRTWDIGARYFSVVKSYNNDKKIGPLSKPGRYYVVTKTGKSGSGGTTQINIIPINESTLVEDYEIDPPADDDIDAVGLYDRDSLDVPRRKTLEEIAEEITDLD